MDELRRIDKPLPPPPPVGGGTASQPGRRRREAFRDYLEREGRGEQAEPDERPAAPPAAEPEPATEPPARGGRVDERA
jgi:hypothetical protein